MNRALGLGAVGAAAGIRGLSGCAGVASEAQPPSAAPSAPSAFQRDVTAMTAYCTQDAAQLSAMVAKVHQLEV
jgi:hypothetical protein